MPLTCHSCGKPFADYAALAKHISESRTGHRKGKRWAAKYRLINGLSAKAKRDLKEKIPLTEEDKENKLSTIREISGVMEFADTICPQCKQRSRQQLPIEYIRSQFVWRTSQGTLRISCINCQGRRTYHDKTWM